MERIRFRWKGREMEGILIKEGPISVVKLGNGYNVALEGIEVLEREPLPERGKGRAGEEAGEGVQEKGRIALLSTGGTIASRVDYETGAVYPAISARELVEQFGLEGLTVKELFSIFSEDFTPLLWDKVAEAAYEALKGLIITHGTDTLHYTSAALSFALSPSGPVALTGAQRSSDRPSSDNALNLRAAYAFAGSGFGEVAVAFHAGIDDHKGVILKGVNVRKMHTSRRDAFKSINIPPLGFTEGLSFTPTQPLERGRPLRLEKGFSPNVGILYVHPGIKPKAVEAFLDYEGLLVLGTGMGHVPTEEGELFSPILKALAELIESGVVVAMAPQTIFGRIDMNVYRTGRKLLEVGVIGNYTAMVPETAFAKLSWILAREKRREKVKELYEANLRGENPPRVLHGEGYC